MGRRDEFKTELISLLNKYSMDNETNTPDFILANFLVGALEEYADTIRSTMEWSGWQDLRTRLGVVTKKED